MILRCLYIYPYTILGLLELFRLQSLLLIHIFVFGICASAAEAAARTSLAPGTTVFIIGLADLLNNTPRNPLYLIVLDIFCLNKSDIILVDIALVKAFLTLVFLRFIKSSSGGNSSN